MFMRKLLLAFLSVLAMTSSFAQSKVELTGTISDENSSETIVDAKIVCNGNQFAKTDFDGKYTLSVEANKVHELKITFPGYDTLIVSVKVGATSLKKDFQMSIYEIEIDEVVIKGETAKSRETPIAFSKLTTKQIQEDLGTRDLPMLLNSTPGAYATEQGGGTGDARVSIRGFDQRNVAVLVDGVPVNDMENGQVYWSNWDGLEIGRAHV